MPDRYTDVVVLAKVESIRGTDALPTAANYVQCRSVTITRNNDLRDTKEYSTVSAGNQPSTRGFRDVQMTIECYERGTGTNVDPANFGALLKGCAVTETVNVAVDVDYEPDSLDNSNDSVTIYAYVRSGSTYEIHKLIGGSGTATLSGSAGEECIWTFTYQGKTENTTTGAAPVVSSYVLDTVPPTLKSASMAFMGWTAMFQSFSFDIGNTVVRVPNGNAADGVAYYVIKDRNPVGQIVALKDRTSKDIISAWENGDIGTFSITFGSTAGNQATLATGTTGKIQITNTGEGDDNNMRNQTIDFKFVDPDKLNEDWIYKRS